MIRDNRRINIETNFFDEDQYFAPKLHQETFETSLLNRDKGAIAIYNILDTIRLHRIINAFNILNFEQKIRIRKYSSREILVPNRSLKKIPQNFTSQRISKVRLNQEEVQDENMIKRVGSIFHNKNRTQSLKGQVRSQSQYLRQSRKRILENISRTLGDKSHERSMEKSLNNHKVIKTVSKQQASLHQNNEIKPPQNDHIKNRIKKLQKLMKNIRRQKQRNQPIVIHQKRQVAQLPKQANFRKHMHFVIEEIQSLRKQVNQIKTINKQILHHSRERSLRSSRTAAKSQSHSIPEALKSLHFKNIKQSQVFDSQKPNSKPNSSDSQKVSNIPQSLARKNRIQQKSNNKKFTEKQSQNKANISKVPAKQRQIDKLKQMPENSETIRKDNLEQRQKYNTKNIIMQTKAIGFDNIEEKQIDLGFNSRSAREPIKTYTKQATQERSVSNTNNKEGAYQKFGGMESKGERANKNMNEEKREANVAVEQRKDKSRNFNIYQFVENYEQKKKASQQIGNLDQRKAQKQYKESNWYKQYGSPSYNAKLGINSQFEKLAPHNLAELNQVTDTFSNYNANSNSNFNSRTSSPKNGLGFDLANYSENNKYSQEKDNFNQNTYYDSYVPSSFKAGESGYTNPDLLRQLNIGPFPKKQSSFTPENEQKYEINPKYGSKNFNTISDSSNQISRSDYSPDYKFNNEKWNSLKTISDGNQMGSYTYSKGSSAATSMAKLEQQYESVINGDSINAKHYSIKDNSSYEPFTSLYSGDRYDSGRIDVAKISSLEEDINKYFSNNMKLDTFQYAPHEWSQDYKRHNSPSQPTQPGYHQFYDKYATNN